MPTARSSEYGGVGALVRGNEEILFSTIVAGELLHGFRDGTRYERYRRELEAFLASPYVTVVPVSMTTADRFARIVVGLKSKGRPIPTNDIWIAAQAMETGADLAFFDRHFDAIDGLVHTCLE